jgi:hypothetical protein
MVKLPLASSTVLVPDEVAKKHDPSISRVKVFEVVVKNEPVLYFLQAIETPASGGVKLCHPSIPS